MTRLFTRPDTWHGGFYELAIELGPRSDERRIAALKTIWQDAAVEGCYKRGDVEPSLQPRVMPTVAHMEGGHLRGVITLPNGVPVACGTFVVREDDGLDWLGFYLPMGALATAYDVGAFPFSEARPARSWRAPLDDRLVEMASHVYDAVPFSLALIGHEVSGTVYSAELAASGVPEERWIGYLLPTEDRLQAHLPTHYEGDLSFDT